MKKMILKTLGLCAVFALMLYNVSNFDTTSNDFVSLAFIENQAQAEGEACVGDLCAWFPTGSCYVTYDCGPGVPSDIIRNYYNYP